MANAVVALGSNLGNRVANVRAALERLHGALTLDGVSSFYETEPVGYTAQPAFLNAVASGHTALSPQALLAALQRIELDFGRTRAFPNAPRTLDLDLLYYDDLVLDTPVLTVPHPRLHERFFVLVPLVEIAPNLIDPRCGQSASELLARLGPPAGIRRSAATVG